MEFECYHARDSVCKYRRALMTFHKQGSEVPFYNVHVYTVVAFVALYMYNVYIIIHVYIFLCTHNNITHP